MFKRTKCFAVSLAVILGVLTPQAVFAANPDARVFLDGQEIVYDVPPQIIGGRTMVPLSKTIEAITGSAAGWEPNTKTVTFRANGHTNVHQIGQKVVYVDGSPVQFDTPSLIIDSRTLVPVRMIAETSGCKVDWDANKKYVIITSPTTVTTALRPVIQGVSLSKSKINKGETVTLTVKTNSAASYVWVECDDADKYAELTSSVSGGTKTWTVSCTPQGSQSLHIYANSARSEIDSAMEIQYIEVGQSSVPSIVSLTASKSSVDYGETVTLTVRTSANVDYVWAEYDGTHKNASFQSTYTNGEKSWSVSIAPSASQRVRVYANVASRSTTGADSRSQDITVYASSPEIFSVTSSQSGESYTFTVKTNSIVKYVWVSCDNSKTYASSKSSSGDTKTWTATVSPSASQRVHIYANSSDSQSGAVYETQQVSAGVSAPKIVSYKTPNGTWIMPGDVFTVTVSTSGNVNYVWVEDVGGEDWQGFLTSSGNSGNQQWEVNCTPSGEGRIKLYIYASTGDSSSSAATEVIYITIGN